MDGSDLGKGLKLFPPFRQSATTYILYVDAAVMTSRNWLYDIGFLPYSEVTFDGAHSHAKFSTDTHCIGLGELMRQTGEQLFGLRGCGGDLGVVVAHEVGKVIAIGNEVRKVLFNEA